MEFIEADSIKSVLDFLKSANTENLKDGSVPSLVVGRIAVGDLVWMPMAYMFVEKAVNAHSVSIKASCHTGKECNRN